MQARIKKMGGEFVSTPKKCESKLLQVNYTNAKNRMCEYKLTKLSFQTVILQHSQNRSPLG